MFSCYPQGSPAPPTPAPPTQASASVRLCGSAVLHTSWTWSLCWLLSLGITPSGPCCSPHQGFLPWRVWAAVCVSVCPRMALGMCVIMARGCRVLSLECFTGGRGCLTTDKGVYQSLEVPEGCGEMGHVRKLPGCWTGPGRGCQTAWPLGALGAPLGSGSGSGAGTGRGFPDSPRAPIPVPLSFPKCRTSGPKDTRLRPSETLLSPGTGAGTLVHWSPSRPAWGCLSHPRNRH